MMKDTTQKGKVETLTTMSRSNQSQGLGNLETMSTITTLYGLSCLCFKPYKLVMVDLLI